MIIGDCKIVCGDAQLQITNLFQNFTPKQKDQQSDVKQKKHIRNWSFMNLIVTEIVGILKSETNIIKREKLQSDIFV